MVGRSQASNLSGMLTSIGDTIGEMGGPGNQYIDTFRRSMAPTPKMDSSVSLNEYSQWARRNGYEDEADRYMVLAEKQRQEETARAKANRLQMGQSSVASLQNEYMRVLKDPAITDPAEREKKLADIQASMNAIAGAVEGMDPSAVGMIGQQAKAADLQTRAQEQQMELDQERNERAWEQFDLSKEEAARADEKHAEWKQTQDYRVEAARLEAEAKQYQAAVNAAKGLVGQDGGREKFVAAFGEERAGVYDSLNRQKQAQELQLEEARAKADKRTWKYTNKQLEEMGFPEEVVTILQRAGENNPAGGHRMLEALLEQQFKTAEMPTSALLGLFKDAALSHIVKEGINVAPWKDSDEDREAAAGKLALKMAERYLATGGSIEEALKEVTAREVSEAEEGGPSEIEQLARAIEADLAAKADEADPDR